ncbi:Npt1/Npt2 family nucleotide transporter [Cardinium endosymbiont of Philonthus spinipes]|uniref:Npt1/Npt2 family nucleotide transporter n=1 Tax=Cardinium endosymbiont of Philonthus spinipes TaxID=3077941 RepID=UPI00313A792E
MAQHTSLSWFKKWLQVIFPIQQGEKQKVFLLLLLKFLISFVYCILAALKDTVLVTANHSAAEVIPIIKGSIIFPISIGVVLLYAKLHNCLKQATLFYSTILFFLGLVLLYGFVLYPHANKVSPHAMADWLSIYTGGKYLHWIAAFRHWIHVLFFVVAELWGQVALMLLYWSFVNNVCKMQDAKRFYAILIAAGDVALIITGPLVLAYTKKYSHSDFVYTIQALIGYVAWCCLAILFTYWFANHTIKPDGDSLNHNTATPPQTLRLSLWDSLKHVATSRYLGNIAIMVVACGLSINIVEGTWKSYLKEAFPKAVAYQSFVSELNFWTGIIALIISLFFSGGILRQFGWKTTARIAPVIIGITGSLFFLMSYSKSHAPCLTHWVGSKLVLYIVIFGGMHNIAAKSIKYAFFDKTTQMAYIPLDRETKIKGKAAVDLLGSRLGKAGSSWIQIALLELMHTNSIQPLSGILLLFLVITTIAWYRATGSVDKQLHVLEAREAK